MTFPCSKDWRGSRYSSPWSYVSTVGNHRMCAGSAAELSRLGPPFSHLHLHQLVALTGRFFQFWPVNNLDVAATVGDETGPLEHSRRYADAGTPGSQHLPQKFLRQGH